MNKLDAEKDKHKEAVKERRPKEERKGREEGGCDRGSGGMNVRIMRM
jgi:hypothetical protein